MNKVALYKKSEKNLVRCTCCQRKCLIAPGNSGYCGVRKNIDGDLYLQVYGKAIAVNIDPIEKKPFYHFLPGSKAFSFGTIGCNFRCKFCQNWDISQATAQIKERYKDDRAKQELLIGKICAEGQDLPPEKIVEYCEENKIPVIAYTYNEPTIFTEYAADIAKLAKEKGIKNVYVTNGYESEECLDFIKGWCDAMNIDIKAYNEDFYMDVCGQVKLQGVLDTVKKAWNKGIWIECTTLLIPDLNDNVNELTTLAKYIASISKDIPWHVTAFHPDYRMIDKPSTPSESLEKAWQIGKDEGLKFVYTGNIFGGHEDTECPKCKEILIEREGMSCIEWKVQKNGTCPKCKEKISGIWK